MLGLLAAAALALQCPPPSPRQVRSTLVNWFTAYRGHDLKGTMAIFDPGVRYQFQGAPDQGWPDLRKHYQREFAAKASPEWRPLWEQVIVSGNLATAFSTWSEYVASNPKPRAAYRTVDVLQRGKDCRWRIVRSVNYPVKDGR
jgi:ketosteroid isomerase-like protein